jgi:uncharacterized protein
MDADPGKRCWVAVDSVAGPLLCAVLLAADDDLEAGLRCAIVQLGEGVADWSAGAVGIWGQLRLRTAIPLDGDRIELYRPLGQDPRQRRRQRARAAARPGVRRVNLKAQ